MSADTPDPYVDDERAKNLVHGLRPTDTLGMPAQLARSPENIAHILDRASESFDRIRTAVEALGWYASIFAALEQQSPDAINTLPENQQANAHYLASLVDTTTEMHRPPQLPITIRKVGDTNTVPLEPQGE